MVLGDRTATVEGMCGVVEDGIVPGLFGFEAGQSGVGDIFAWFVDHAVPPAYHEAAAAEIEIEPRIANDRIAGGIGIRVKEELFGRECRHAGARTEQRQLAR